MTSKISDVLFVPGHAGFFNLDLKVSQRGEPRDGFMLRGAPLTPGFDHPTQPGRAVSVLVRLDSGLIAEGDCVDVILAGAAGRDPLFIPEAQQPCLENIRARLVGREVTSFLDLVQIVEQPLDNGALPHTAIRYGFSQALLHAAALDQRRTMAEVLASELDSTLSTAKIPVLVNSPVHDPLHIDRVIAKQADLLPHGSFTNVQRDLGTGGEKLLDYAARLVRRIGEIGAPGYLPTIHLDVYGTIGQLCDANLPKVIAFLRKLHKTVSPFPLIIECPLIAQSRSQQIDVYAELTLRLQDDVGLYVAVDEWCNTFEDVVLFSDARAGHYLQIKMPDLGGIQHSAKATLYARSKGMKVSLGGSLNETEISARVSAHVAMATSPTYLFAKPGYGGDEALMMARNEMGRIIALTRPF